MVRACDNTHNVRNGKEKGGEREEGGVESAILGPRLFSRFIYYPLKRTFDEPFTQDSTYAYPRLAGLSDVVNRHIYTTRVLDPENQVNT